MVIIATRLRRFKAHALTVLTHLVGCTDTCGVVRTAGCYHFQEVCHRAVACLTELACHAGHDLLQVADYTGDQAA